MNIEKLIESVARVENAAGVYYYTFPYTSSVGITTEPLSVRVPIKSENPSLKDKAALAEAIGVQGGIGVWRQDHDGSICLVSAD